MSTIHIGKVNKADQIGDSTHIGDQYNTGTEAPDAKAVFEALQNIQNKLEELSIELNQCNIQPPHTERLKNILTYTNSSLIVIGQFLKLISK
jgi:hypothetical protein